MLVVTEIDFSDRALYKTKNKTKTKTHTHKKNPTLCQIKIWFLLLNIPWQRTDKRMSKLIEIKVRVTKIKKKKLNNLRHANFAHVERLRNRFD